MLACVCLAVGLSGWVLSAFVISGVRAWQGAKRQRVLANARQRGWL